MTAKPDLNIRSKLLFLVLTMCLRCPASYGGQNTGGEEERPVDDEREPGLPGNDVVTPTLKYRSQAITKARPFSIELPISFLPVLAKFTQKLITCSDNKRS